MKPTVIKISYIFNLLLTCKLFCVDLLLSTNYCVFVEPLYVDIEISIIWLFEPSFKRIVSGDFELWFMNFLNCIWWNEIYSFFYFNYVVQES